MENRAVVHPAAHAWAACDVRAARRRVPSARMIASKDLFRELLGPSSEARWCCCGTFWADGEVGVPISSPGPSGEHEISLTLMSA